MDDADMPKRIYVKWDADPNDPASRWLTAEEDLDGNFDDGDTVGIYELKTTRVMRITHELT